MLTVVEDPGGFFEPDPPHAAAIAVRTSGTTAALADRGRAPIRCGRKTTSTISMAGSDVAAINGIHRPRTPAGAPDARAEVTIVIVVCADDAPGTTAAGANEQAVPAGRLAQLSDTAF